MDILKKMFTKNPEHKSETHFKDEFRKPTWFEDNETDDELFDSNRKFIFQMFTNPYELQKHFEQQMQEVMKQFKEIEEGNPNFDRNGKEEYLKPGFEDFMEEYKKHKNSLDTDLDGEIYADQLHSLLQRLSPEVKTMLPEKIKPKMAKPKEKLSDEEKIMGKIHGTILDEIPALQPRRREIMPRMTPHYGGAFEGTYQGPKMFGQSIMTQTVRKPDGTIESKKIVRDTDGNVKTTVTRAIDGKTETITTYGDGREPPINDAPAITDKIEPNPADMSPLIPSDRNIYVSKMGYALPRNMW